MDNEFFKSTFDAVDKNKKLVLAAERYIWNNPEIGFKEWKTSAYLEEKFNNLGYELIKPDNIPGFYTDFDTGIPGPKILLLGELDSVICSGHPEADPETGAVHACGHNVQCAALLGIAAALMEEGVSEGLCGSIRLCAVPAEEGIDIQYREELRKKGIIHYYSGKLEYMYRGFFDDVDIAMIIHANTEGKGFKINSLQNNGNIKKRIVFKGVASHAAAPYNAVNALYAANLGLNAINALRETFEEENGIRVHPIITNGGTSVNAIPSEVIIETHVRGASEKAIHKENLKINRALAGAAVSMGAKVFISDRPGASPLINNKDMIEVAKEVMGAIVPPENIEIQSINKKGSTDMGCISAVIPSLHPVVTGAVGTPHGNDYYIKDPEYVCINSAKAQLGMVKVLLFNNAEKAKAIIAKKEVRYPSIEAYLNDINNFNQDKELVEYKEDGTIVIK